MHVSATADLKLISFLNHEHSSYLVFNNEKTTVEQHKSNNLQET